MIKRITAIFVAVALGLGLSLVAATSAQAHTGDLSVSSVCQTDGTYKLTASLQITKTNENGTTYWKSGTSSFEGTPTKNTPKFANGPVQSHNNPSTIVLGTVVLPGSTTGLGPWFYAATVFTGDNYFVGSDGQLLKALDGTCGDTPSSQTITYCHYDNNGSFVKSTSSLLAFFNAGHTTHPNDIFPAGTLIKAGKSYSWPAQGDQALLASANCLAIDASAAITVSTPACNSASIATWTGLLNATGGNLDASIGTHTAVATATSNHRFPAGTGVSADGKTLTVTYTIAGAISGSPCWPTNATAGVTVTPPSCLTGATATPNAGTFIDHVTTSGQTTGAGTEIFVFTALTGHKFPAGDGVSADGSTKTITQVLAGADTSLCPTLVPNSPVVKDLCGVDNDHYGLPVGPAGVVYTRDGKDIVATIASGNVWGALPSGWVLQSDGTAKYAFTNTDWTNVDCYPPAPCVLSGSSDTEAGDLAPVQGLDGLVFDGPTATGQAKDIYYRVLSGNAQGISGIGYTVLPGSSGFTAQIVIEVDPNTDLSATPGVNHYATLTALVSGSGAFTNLENQPIWYTSKIAYGDAGGQGHPISYAALVSLMPANTLLSAPSLHLQSESPSEAHSVVSSLTSSCGTFNYGLIHVASTVQHSNQSCNADAPTPTLVGGVITVGLTDHVSYSIKDANMAVVPFGLNGATGELAPGTYSVVATPDSGYGLDPDVSGTVVINAYGQDCGRVEDSVAPSATASNQYCNTDVDPATLVNGFITVHVATGIDYVVTNSVNAVIPFDPNSGKTALLPVGDYSVTPTAQAGFVLTDTSVIPLHVGAYLGVDCVQLVDHPLVDPSTSRVQLGCNTSGSYTLTNSLGDANAIVWTVNGSPVAQNTYKVTGPGHFVITAAPAAGFGFGQDAQTQWVYDFAVPTSCDLVTLALTGSTPGGVVALAAFLLLFGLVLIRRSVLARKTARS